MWLTNVTYYYYLPDLPAQQLLPAHTCTPYPILEGVTTPHPLVACRQASHYLWTPQEVQGWNAGTSS
jgi:hypothetical protein